MDSNVKPCGCAADVLCLHGIPAADPAGISGMENWAQPRWPLVEVISGGQTGADQAGLRAAKALGYETGGMLPKGWRTENGTRHDFTWEYHMAESRFRGYDHRTRTNVRDSDGTVIFGLELLAIPEDEVGLDGGSDLTRRACRSFNKPCVLNPTAEELRAWIVAHHITILNVAGNRESKTPGIGARVEALLLLALARD